MEPTATLPTPSAPAEVLHVEVPVLVSRTGHVRALPGSTPVSAGDGRSLIESAALPPDVADRVAAAARTGSGGLAPGAHTVALAVSADGGVHPCDVVGLEGWAIAEELLGADLAADGTLGRHGREVVLPDVDVATGHAVEARLFADGQTTGTVVSVRLPRGAGIRVLSSAAPGEPADGVLVRLLAHGRDRGTAMARIHRALLDTGLVVSDAATNRCALIAAVEAADPALTRPQQPTDAVALLAAAIRVSDLQRAVEQDAFHARAARGRPEPARVGGIPATLALGGHHYRLEVFRTGPQAYRVAADGQVAEVEVHRLSSGEWDLSTGGRRSRIVCSDLGGSCRVEVDGRAHTILRDEGVPVRAQWPSLVVSVPATVGAEVRAGDPLVVVEAMKMESTIRSPFDGVVVGVEVLPNAQVDAGTPLARLRPVGAAAPADAPGDAPRASFAGMALATGAAHTPFQRVYATLRRYLLGYDLDPAALAATLAEHRSFASRTSAGDPQLLAAEDEFLDLFTEVGLLWQTERELGTHRGPFSAREYILAYLQWLDPDRAALPDLMRRRLSRALARYGVADLHRSPELEEAVVLLFGSGARLNQLAAVASGILERRLKFRDRIQPLVDEGARTRYDRLTAATEGMLDTVADLSRDARFRFVDEPLLDAGMAQVQARMEVALDELEADPRGPRRDALVDELVACGQPMRELLLRRFLRAPDPAVQQAILEVRARRWYRNRELHNLSVDVRGGVQMCTADYDFEQRRIHVVMVAAPVEDIPGLGEAVAEHMAQVDPSRSPIVDVMSWRSDCSTTGDDLVAALQEATQGWDLGRPIWRLDLTVTSICADAEPETRTQYVTFRGAPGGGLAEDRFYRNLHPMLAKRLEVWRLGNFELTRMPSPEDVYLFHGIARDNPKDHRLFAMAEVRDLTAVSSARGTIYPRLERMGLQAIIAMRQARATFPGRERPLANRITLFVRPPWDVPRERWAGIAELLVPLAPGAGLEMVVLRTHIPQPDGSLAPTVLNAEGILGRSVTIREEPERDDPVRPLTPYRQKVLTSERFGVPYPFEILRMFAPSADTVGTFPPGSFVEHDLDDSGERLVPVDREPGLNSANLIVGLITTYTPTYPEGMTRVALLSDPTKGLGNLAEPECRRVNAAMALAAQLQVPLEWFAVSSGALISMKSGTENMDWIADTLRRIIEFTQDGGEINIIVTGINVGGQPYWNAEATMLMHTRGILVMTPTSAMVLTGKQALDFSGGVSADDNFGIGGFERVMGPNGQAQYWAPSLADACALLLAHYEYTYVVPGERFPRRRSTTDPVDRDVRPFPHAQIPDCDFTEVGDVFSAEHNPERKKPFDVRSVMRAVTDADCEPLERWARWRGGENSVVWDARIGGMAVCLLGLESRPVPRRGFVPADGPPSWTSGTLFPQASRKTARAVNAASGNRPLVVLANLSGFDGSPESMRHWQLEYGAEIGRAVTNFRGPIVFVVISRYHGGAFVVFSKALNAGMEVAAVEGSFASVIGGAPAAATVFAREVRTRVEKDPRVVAARALLARGPKEQAGERRARLAEITEQVRSEKLGEAAAEFDAVHTIDRALQMGSVDRIIRAVDLRPYVIEALERGMARDLERGGA